MPGENLSYQLLIDGRAAGPVREVWDEAARDAVSAGVAVWHGDGIKFGAETGAEIQRQRTEK